MSKLRFTPRAESDLYEIWATIAADNPRATDGVLVAAVVYGARDPQTWLSE